MPLRGGAAFREGTSSKDAKEGGKVGFELRSKTSGEDDNDISGAAACVQPDPRTKVEEEGGKEGGEGGAV
jgi:hypothetical protein